jgi:acyl dehydratase
MNAPAPYRVQAYNTARESENKIHDDTVARRFGFSGGLVPGVDVYAYMAHAPVQYWGRAWLERGTADIRLLKPVYDGNEAVVTAAPAEDGGLALRVESAGQLCATGHAALEAAAPSPPDPEMFHASPPHANRPPADEVSLPVGASLGMQPLVLTQDFASAYLRDLRETDPIYEREGIAHPGLILRTGNWALSHNVVLGPWMHVGSTVRNFGLARIGDEITVRAQVTANYERKGHRFVELDALVLANATRPVARLAHVAIYRPRQVVEAA